MTISRYVVLAAIAITAAFPSTASAESSPVLHGASARRVMALYLSEQQELGHNYGYAVNACHRYSRILIWCFIVEYGVEWQGFGVGDLYYRLRAKRSDGAIRLLSSLWDDLNYEFSIRSISRGM